MAKNILGQTYFCPVCGVEISVTLIGNGELTPVCCERPMIRGQVIDRIYFCPTCGAQIMLIKSCSDKLVPICCHIPMREIITSQAA